ncbi:hypothetical protein KY329_01100 [Candidatus Woesearchaeota archaeon]|nr:hypothetical protein [Candidatus Woesearchaeota archaeon]
MRNLNQQVWNIIQQEPETLKGLRKSVINVRALAKHYINAYKLRASLDAVISSIRRFDLTKDEAAEQTVMDKLKGASISTKNRISCVTLRKEHRIKSRKDCKLVIGSTKMKIFGPTGSIKNLGILDEHLVGRTDNLSEISVKMREDISQTKGVLAKVTNEIFSNDINIEDIVVCQPEFLIYLKTENLGKAHDILLQLVE